ncbi:hypothetical protein BST61_g11281 [Cercospora zeina]
MAAHCFRWSLLTRVSWSAWHYEMHNLSQSQDHTACTTQLRHPPRASSSVIRGKCQLDANNQLYSMLVGAQLNFHTDPSSYEATAPQLVTFDGAELDIRAFSESWASLNIQYQQQQSEWLAYRSHRRSGGGVLC